MIIITKHNFAHSRVKTHTQICSSARLALAVYISACHAFSFAVVSNTAGYKVTALEHRQRKYNNSPLADSFSRPIAKFMVNSCWKISQAARLVINLSWHRIYI